MYYSSCLLLWSLHLNHVAAACLQAPFLPPQPHSLQLLVLIQNLPSPFLPVSSDTSFVLLQPIFRSISSAPLTPWGIWPLGVDRYFLALSQSPSQTCLLGHLYSSATHHLQMHSISGTTQPTHMSDPKKTTATTEQNIHSIKTKANISILKNPNHYIPDF